MIKACIFDMDGVIVDTAKYHFKAWARLADTLSIPFTEEQNEQLKGVSRVDSLERILEWGHVVIDNNKKLELMDLKNKWYLDYVAEINPGEMLPGAHAFLLELHAKGIKIALGSSSKNSILILDKLGITHLFESIIDGTKLTFGKPHPEVFLKGATELNLKPHECVVFEDAISGVEAAKAGGFHCIGIGSADILSKADAIIDNLEGFTIEKLGSLIQA
ncbi:MAG: beta-phosphoglucomutase [Flavobacteriales bacterium]